MICIFIAANAQRCAELSLTRWWRLHGAGTGNLSVFSLHTPLACLMKFSQNNIFKHLNT